MNMIIQFLELRPVIKVTVIPKRDTTLHNPKMHPNSEFLIPTSNNIGDMLLTRCEHSNTLDSVITKRLTLGA